MIDRRLCCKLLALSSLSSLLCDPFQQWRLRLRLELSRLRIKHVKTRIGLCDGFAVRKGEGVLQVGWVAVLLVVWLVCMERQEFWCHWLLLWERRLWL